MANGLGDLTSGFTNYVEMLRCFGTWEGSRVHIQSCLHLCYGFQKHGMHGILAQALDQMIKRICIHVPSLLLTNCVNLGDTCDLTLHSRMKVLD